MAPLAPQAIITIFCQNLAAVTGSPAAVIAQLRADEQAGAE